MAISLEGRKRAKAQGGVDGKKKLEIKAHFSPNSHPFDDIEWGIRDAVAGDFRQDGVEAPVFWSDSAVGIVAKLYFATINGVRERSVKTLISRVAKKITDEGRVHGHLTEENALTFETELIYILVNQIAAFNTPIWLNLGVPGRKQCCSACYLLNVEDHMFGEDSITDWWLNEAKVFKTGAGSGVNLSKLRGSMERISIGGIASGPVSFIRPADSSAGTIKSGSVARRAAKLVCLDIDHPDVLDFIDSKVREDKRMRILAENGINMDPSTPAGETEIAESTSFQNANISVRLSDRFMQAVENDDDWVFTERTTGNAVGEPMPAKDILRKVADAAWECADPGVMFDDTINRWHTTPSEGRINTSNPCCEVHQNDNTSCNLASLNLIKFVLPSGEFKGSDFNQAVDIMITAMDITCSFSELPTDILTQNTRDYRQLGLGYSNLGAALMVQGMPYDSDEGRDWASAVTSLMTVRAYKRSGHMADVLGPFAYYASNAQPMGDVIQGHINACYDLKDSFMADCAKAEWDFVSKYHDNGFRNSQVTVIAPTGTISFMMDCDTTGAEPAYSLFTYKKLAAGGTMEQTLKCYDIIKDQLGLTHEAFRLPAICQTAAGDNPISYQGHLDMVAAIQPHISGAISKTTNLPNDVTADDIFNVYVGAWQRGIKCVAVYRDGSKSTQILSTKKDEPKTFGIEEISGLDVKLDPETLETVHRRRMPRERESITHKFQIGEHEGYITAGKYDDGSLGEIFLSGIGKEGSTLRGMMDAWAIAFSLGLQHGVPLEVFAQKFSHMRFDPEGITNNPEIRIAKSVPDYITRWLVSKFGSEEEHAEFGIMTDKIKKASMDDFPQEEQAGNGHVTVVDTGKACTCGTLMVRTGTCYTCPACGNNTGCG